MRALLVALCALAFAGCQKDAPVPDRYLGIETVDQMILTKSTKFSPTSDGQYLKHEVFVASSLPGAATMACSGSNNCLFSPNDGLKVWNSPEESTAAAAIRDYIAHEAKR